MNDLLKRIVEHTLASLEAEDARDYTKASIELAKEIEALPDEEFYKLVDPWEKGPDGYPKNSRVMKEQVKELLEEGAEYIERARAYLEDK